MGLGHVPAGSVPQERSGADLSRRQRRGGRTPGVQAARSRRDLGRLGERLAARFLARRGGRLVTSNLRSGSGEIDLLMAFGSAIVAVEVKTRVDEDPLIQLTAEKERRMWEAAARLRPRPTRIDIVTVRLDRTGIMIRWIPGVI